MLTGKSLGLTFLFLHHREGILDGCYFSKRTSEGAFDTRSEVAMAIKKRTFDLLGIFPYDESFADGLQARNLRVPYGRMCVCVCVCVCVCILEGGESVAQPQQSEHIIVFFYFLYFMSSKVLRYNQTAAYISHMDWIEPTPETDHDWESAGMSQSVSQ